MVSICPLLGNTINPSYFVIINSSIYCPPISRSYNVGMKNVWEFGMGTRADVGSEKFLSYLLVWIFMGNTRIVRENIFCQIEVDMMPFGMKKKKSSMFQILILMTFLPLSLNPSIFI